MVRRPWLRSTRLLAGAPTASVSDMGRPSERPAGPSADDVVTLPEAFALEAFLAAGDRTGLFVAGAGSPWTLGDPMPGAW